MGYHLELIKGGARHSFRGLTDVNVRQLRLSSSLSDHHLCRDSISHNPLGRLKVPGCLGIAASDVVTMDASLRPSQAH